MTEIIRATSSIKPYLLTKGHFAGEEFEPGIDVVRAVQTAKILVLGAGGLGCELLKNLAGSGFRDIHVIDMDTIDLSNLNRQFLFRQADIGQPKALVAANFINRRFKHVNIIPHFGRLEDQNDEFYKQFTLVISGLDSVEARRWINHKLVSLVNPNDFDSVKPLIDGGTEGFRGQVKIIFPTFTACYECSLDTLSGQTTYPMCTIANNPRLPEHCIEYVSTLKWPQSHKDEKLDMDIPEHVEWVYKNSLSRAQQFKIEGVTKSLVLGVVKNIIPSIASTNAIIAAACVNEAFKIVTSANPVLENFMMYSGTESVFTYTFSYEKKDNCAVCGGR